MEKNPEHKNPSTHFERKIVQMAKKNERRREEEKKGERRGKKRRRQRGCGHADVAGAAGAQPLLVDAREVGLRRPGQVTATS